MSKSNENQQKIRIKLKAYDHKVLDNSCKQIFDELTITAPDLNAIRRACVSFPAPGGP